MSESNSHVELAAEIVSAYVSNNSVPASELPTLLNDVHAAIVRVASGAQPIVVEAAKPAVPPKKSITNDYIVCLEDGRKFKSLKRHLRTQYNLSPEEYREKWGLAGGLSDGRASLREGALGAGQADGPRSAASASQVRRSESREDAPIGQCASTGEASFGDLTRRPCWRLAGAFAPA